MHRTALGLVTLALASSPVFATEELVAMRIDRSAVVARGFASRVFYNSGLNWFFLPGAQTTTVGMLGHSSTQNGGTIHEVTACLYNAASIDQTFKATVSVEQGVLLRQAITLQDTFAPETDTCHTLTGFNSTLSPGPFAIQVQFNKFEADNINAGLTATDGGQVFDVQIGPQRPPTASGPQGPVTIRGVGIRYLIEEVDSPPPPPPPPVGNCVRNAQTACILNGRFEVKVSMKNFATPPVTFPGVIQLYNGQSSETDQSVSFYSFNNGNVEVFVKMVNACSTASPAFWLFAAGATNAETDITVRDTVSGQIQEIHSPSGLLFETVAHTGAFFTCP